MANVWLMRAIAMMTGGGESQEDAAQRLRNANAQSANGHRILREYAQSARAGDGGEGLESASVVPDQNRAAAIMENNRLAKVRQGKAAPGKARPAKGKKAPSPSFR